MKTAIYPGSFDPITNGHLDIIERASRIFDKVIVAVLINVDKDGLFNIDERVALIEKVINKFNNVQVKCFKGLLVDFLRREESSILIKGLRGATDFEYEHQMALINKKLDDDVETLFMMANTDYSYVSSSMIKQVGMFGGCVKGLIPEEILEDFNKKIEGFRG